MVYIIFRGPGGSGKSTVAQSLQKQLEGKAALLCPDFFYYDVCGEEDQNSSLVYEGLYRLADLYLSEQYHVILEGILSGRNDYGQLRIEEFLDLGRIYRVRPFVFYLEVPLDVCVQRDRERKISMGYEKTQIIWEKSQSSRHDGEIVIDGMKPVETIVRSILSHF